MLSHATRREHGCVVPRFDVVGQRTDGDKRYPRATRSVAVRRGSKLDRNPKRQACGAFVRPRVSPEDRHAEFNSHSGTRASRIFTVTAGCSAVFSAIARQPARREERHRGAGRSGSIQEVCPLNDIHLEKGMHASTVTFGRTRTETASCTTKRARRLRLAASTVRLDPRAGDVVTSGFAAGASIKAASSKKAADEISPASFRDPEGGRTFLFQRIRNDTKRKTRRA